MKNWKAETKALVKVHMHEILQRPLLAISTSDQAIVKIQIQVDSKTPYHAVLNKDVVLPDDAGPGMME